MSGLKPISAAIKTVSNKTFDRKFVLLGRIISNWSDIVGEKMHLNCQPVKIRYRKNKKKYDAVLEIAATSAVAAKLQYQTGLLLEKLHQILGEQTITSIRFVHIPANKTKILRASKKQPITSSQKNNLNSLLSNINDVELKERLATFGTSFYEDMNQNNIGIK